MYEEILKAMLRYLEAEHDKWSMVRDEPIQAWQERLNLIDTIKTQLGDK